MLNDAGSETTKKLIDLADPESCLTPLQTVSAEGFPELVLSLLEYGADPTVCGTSGRGSKTAYSLAKDRETRNMFRRYMAAHVCSFQKYIQLFFFNFLAKKKKKKSQKSGTMPRPMYHRR